jgi:hypothetical protein
VSATVFMFPDVNPSMPDPPTHNPTHKKTSKKAKENYTAEFEAFWTPYPRKLNCSKLMAFRAWCKLDYDEQAHAMRALPIFVRMCRGKEEQFIPHAATWLNQRRYETVQIPVQPQTDINIDWAAVMKLYRITSNWHQEYGPPPGLKGCRVPQQFLE